MVAFHSECCGCKLWLSIAISNVDFAPFAVFSLQEDVTTVSKELGHAKEGVTLENLFVEEMDACSMSDIV